MEYFVTANGIPVHVSEEGKGEKVILFLHGYLETLYIWEEFRDLFPDSFHFLSIDLPGHGLSGSHPVSNDMAFDADVILSLLDKLHIDRFIIIGHSMGGYVGQAVLKKAPNRVSALLHLNSNVHADLPEKKTQRLREIEFINNGKLVTLAQLAVPNMYAKSNLPRCEDKIQETVEICETHDPFGVSATVRGLMSRDDNEAFLKTVRTPLFFLFGDQDTYTSPDAANALLASISNACGVFIKDSGHNSFIEQPSQTADAVLQFLRRHSLL